MNSENILSGCGGFDDESVKELFFKDQWIKVKDQIVRVFGDAEYVKLREECLIPTAKLLTDPHFESLKIEFNGELMVDSYTIPDELSDQEVDNLCQKLKGVKKYILTSIENISSDEYSPYLDYLLIWTQSLVDQINYFIAIIKIYYDKLGEEIIGGQTFIKVAGADDYGIYQMCIHAYADLNLSRCFDEYTISYFECNKVAIKLDPYLGEPTIWVHGLEQQIAPKEAEIIKNIIYQKALVAIPGISDWKIVFSYDSLKDIKARLNKL